MDANRLKYASDSPPSLPLLSPAPSVWYALGLIALYFALQLAVGGLIGLTAGVVVVLQNGEGLGEVIHQARAWLGQPDASAIAVMVTLLTSAALTMHLTYRRWPALWHRSELPGLGFIPTTAPTIRIRPTIKLKSTCSERNKTELSRPITGTSKRVNDVVSAGKFFETVINAQNGNAVIKGPL